MAKHRNPLPTPEEMAKHDAERKESEPELTGSNYILDTPLHDTGNVVFRNLDPNTEGQLYILPPFTPHEYHPDGEIWRTLWMTFNGTAARHIQQGQHHFFLLFCGEDRVAESLREFGSLFHGLAQSAQRSAIAFQFFHAGFFTNGKESRGIAPGHDIADHCSTTLVNDLSIRF